MIAARRRPVGTFETTSQTKLEARKKIVTRKLMKIDRNEDTPPLDATRTHVSPMRRLNSRRHSSLQCSIGKILARSGTFVAPA